jgi:hypothetical protein
MNKVILAFASVCLLAYGCKEVETSEFTLEELTECTQFADFSEVNEYFMGKGYEFYQRHDIAPDNPTLEPATTYVFSTTDPVDCTESDVALWNDARFTFFGTAGATTAGFSTPCVDIYERFCEELKIFNYTATQSVPTIAEGATSGVMTEFISSETDMTVITSVDVFNKNGTSWTRYSMFVNKE